MNSSINISSSTPVSGSTKSSNSAASSTLKTDQETPDGGQISDSSSTPASFKESIKKAYDDSQTKPETDTAETSDSELDGNNLPVSEDITASSEQDDRLLIPAGLNLTTQPVDNNKIAGQINQVQTQNLESKKSGSDNISNNSNADGSELIVDNELEQLTTLANTKSIDSVDSKQNVLTAPIRQLLNNEPATNNKILQSGTVNSASGNVETTNTPLEKTAIQMTESIQLNTEQLNLIAKSQSLTSSGSQQLLQPNIQSSLLQTASAQVDPNIDALPLVTNSPTNSLSTINLPSAVQAEIPQAFGRPGWSQGVGKQVLLMVNQNITSAEIRLNPAHLGPIEILIDMSEDQVNVSMNSRHAIVREAMEQALPKLREMLEENGFNLADTDISKHSFAEQREQNDDNEKSRNPDNTSEQMLASEISTQTMQQSISASGVVDYYI